MAGAEEGRRSVHPDCRNASNPYHECVDFCFRLIAEAKRRKEMEKIENEESSKIGIPGTDRSTENYIEPSLRHSGDASGSADDHTDDNGDDDDSLGAGVDPSTLTGRQKKLFELRLKMNEARKANQIDIVAEKKRLEAPPESRGISKQKWLEERKKKIGKLLDANNLDISSSYMLDTQEMAEKKYKKWEKEPAPFGWDVFNQKTLYDAYKKRTKNIEVDMDQYKKLRESDPEFYRSASSLQYGKIPKVSEDKMDKMVKELQDREEKRKAFSRRRRFHEEKDIDSINDRNEHFNKKIERAFGKYTTEIKNNLERGTALPD
ncbi:Pre-mRNA-splicing factor [Nymphaea thermarum]|nr:Pre-mRNA-splicing factor [Nymphaea thermarum]